MINWEKILDGKVIAIFGGTKGIGRAVAVEAARQGANVVIGGRDEAAAKEIIEEIEGYGQKAIFVRVDPLNHPEDCANLIEQGAAAFGRLDGLFNYAGIMPSAEITEATPEQFHEVMTMNAMAPMLISGAAIRYMKEHGGGSIVQNGSPHAWSGEMDRVVYGMSKGALKTLSEHITKNYARYNIRCNFITMGWVPTPGELAHRMKTQGMDGEELRRYAAGFIPMGRMQEFEDHVPGIIYLLSDLSSQVSGSNLRVTGGFYI